MKFTFRAFYLNHKIAIFFMLLFIYSHPSFAQEKKWNIRLGYPLFIVEYGSANLGIGLGFRDFYKNQMLGEYESIYSAFRIGLRTSYYFSDFGKDTIYFAIEGGTESRTSRATIESLDEDFEGSANGTYMAAHVGYHWFWKTINISFGLGVLQNNHPSYLIMGSKGSTITSPAQLTISPSFELSLGYQL